jgi:hypothetical protein
VKVRVLCLHDESSSALSLIRQIQKVGNKQLHHDHGIELAFVNSPHLTNINININININMNNNMNMNTNGSACSTRTRSGSRISSDENENANESDCDG